MRWSAMTSGSLSASAGRCPPARSPCSSASGEPSSPTRTRDIFRQQSGGEWYAFTQFEETDARRAFPCVDEPSAKIPWTLSLRIPSGLKAVANAPEESSTPAGEGMILVRFRTTRPLPSYLVAFGVGPFDFVDGRPAGKRKVPVRIVVPRGRAREGAYAARVSPEILEGLEDYFGIAYPYEKLDILTIPFTVQFGAMENAGLVTFREASVLARPEEDGVRRRRRFAAVAAHEFAHQWFGDLVTPAWWNDTWLNEAFATWMETKVIERWAPSWGMAAERVDERNRARPPTDALVTARRIRQPIESYNDIRNAFDAITYQKGAAVIRMFELYVGEAAFQRGIRQYLPNPTPTATPPRPTSSARSQRRRAGTWRRRSAPSSTSRASPAFAPLSAAGADRGRWCTWSRTAGPRLRRPAGNLATPGLRPVGDPAASGRRSARCSISRPPTSRSRPATCPDWVLPNAGYSGYYRLQLESALHERVVRSRALDDAEVVGLLGDTNALVKGGAVPRDVGLALAARYARSREHHVTEAAVKLATVREEFLPGRLASHYEAWVRRTFGDRAAELGFAARPGENDEAKLIRPELVHFVARRGEDPRLIVQAQRLAGSWLTRSEPVDPDTLWSVMETAGRAGGAPFHDQLVKRLGESHERRQRGWLLDGIASTVDPGRLDSNVALAASGALEPREMERLLAGKYREADPPVDSPHTRAAVLAGVDSHWDSLVRLMPPGSLGWLFRLASTSCSQEERARAEQVFGPRAEAALGGPRWLAQSLEALDLCIAQKQREVPSLQRFFAPSGPPRVAEQAPGQSLRLDGP